MKTEFFCTGKLSPLNLRERFSTVQTVKSDFLKTDTILKASNLYKNNCTFISPIYTFPWRETYLFACQNKVQKVKSSLIIIFINRKGCRLWREINTFPSISSLTDRNVCSFRRKSTVRCVGNGHQSGYSRADIINKNISKRSKVFPYKA